MKFTPENIYHVYNQGNNHECLFLNDDHYKHFIHLFKAYVLPNCEVLAWCLMPNHFHYLLYMDERCTEMKQQGGLILDPVTNGFRKLLSAYSHQFNIVNDRSGALFRPKTKAKCLSEESMISNTPYSLSDYSSNCFNYIHYNPVKAGLVKNASDWYWSSYNFYFGNQELLLCNQELAIRYCLFNINNEPPDGGLINYIPE
jgi:putative transposase